MRVVVTTDTVGGVWRFSQELIAGLLESGDAVALVSFGQVPSRAQCAECAQLASEWGEAFLFVPSSLRLEWMQNNGECFDQGAPLLDEVIRNFRADLLHSNQFCWGALPAKLPKIVTAHSDVLSWWAACRAGAPEESAWLARYRKLVQCGLNQADLVTAPTGWMLRALGERFRLHEGVRVVPNGRDIPPSLPTPCRLQAVTAGRLWDEAKDVALLGQVKTRMPLLAAGETMRDGVSIPCPEGVQCLGSLDDRDLLHLFHESAVYVCTSIYEPFGLAPLEAALCGCAVVARKIDSLLEVWGDSAIYFEKADDLSELLTWLHDDRDSLRKARQRAFERAARYTRGAMVRSYRSLYSAVTEMASVS